MLGSLSVTWLFGDWQIMAKDGRVEGEGVRTNMGQEIGGVYDCLSGPRNARSREDCPVALRPPVAIPKS